MRRTKYISPQRGLALGRIGIMGLLAFALMGLGGGDDGDAGTIPIPAKSYSVRLTDREGNALDGERFTWEGKVHVRAQFGNATVTVPFEKLQALHITPGAEPDRVRARAEMKNGQSLEITLDATSKLYAITEFGNYEIFAADLGSAVFQP